MRSVPASGPTDAVRPVPRLLDSGRRMAPQADYALTTLYWQHMCRNAVGCVLRSNPFGRWGPSVQIDAGSPFGGSMSSGSRDFSMKMLCASA